ncbi:MAG: NTP transferase domain-containing protein [Bacteroidetes bacterium]|nr:NTP transferase domain-containing protein [Bacteroidota bacterium]
MDKKLSAIVLAAGRGGRLGYPKIYAKFGEPACRTGVEFFLERIVNRIRSVGIQNVSVVTFPNCENNRFSVQCNWIINPDPARGMLSSLYEGVKGSDNSDGYLIIPVDHPLVRIETLSRMKLSFESSACDVLKSRWNDRTGHPVIISKRVADNIPSEDCEGGLNTFITDNKFTIEYVDVEDEGIITNINTESDLEEAIKRGRR